MHAKTQYLFPKYPTEESIWEVSKKKKKKVNPIDKQSKEKPQDDNWEQLIQTRAYKKVQGGRPLGVLLNIPEIG